MKLINDNHIFTGMQKDLSISKHPENYLFDAQNIRINLNEQSNMLSITNERGPLLALNTIVQGTQYLGHCLIGKYLVVFSKGEWDYITRIDLEKLSKNPLDENATIELFNGNLNFQADHPIEAIASYENEKIQKVYWTDGINQPRVINTVTNYDGVLFDKELCTLYDFVRELSLNEEVKVQKILGGGGLFPSGVIQYAITYYDKFGQETNIAHTTPLQYISFNDRGGSPEEKIDNSFKITISHVDTSFNFLRIYSILRTSLNGTPICKRIQDIEIKGQTTISFVDTGTVGDNIDPYELLYKGGEQIAAKTIQDKNGTLFLGNISLTRPNLKAIEYETGTNITLEQAIQKNIKLEKDIRQVYTNITGGSYSYGNQLTSKDGDYTYPCGGFKTGDYYRCGVQFQYKTGKWSDPIFLEDFQIKERPKYFSTNGNLVLPTIKAILPSNIASQLMQLGYKRVRAVVVFPQLKDRYVVCQGVANATSYTSYHRDTAKDIYAQSSWFFRPQYGTSYSADSGGSISPKLGAMIYTENTTSYNPSNIRQVEIEGYYNNDNRFVSSLGISTLHSPDIEFDNSLSAFDYSSVRYRKVGTSIITSTLSNITIQTKTPTASSDGSGVIAKSFNRNGASGIISGLFYDDYIVDDIGKSGNFGAWEAMKSPAKWMVYAWNAQGSLNNDINRPVNQGEATAILKKKIISNLRYSSNTNYDSSLPPDNSSFSISPQLFKSDQVSILKLQDYIYLGNVDTLLTPDKPDGKYFAFNGTSIRDTAITSFTDAVAWKTFSLSPTETKKQGIWKFENNAWSRKDGSTGDAGYLDLIMKKQAVRMKYKSTPHLVLTFNSSPSATVIGSQAGLPVVEIVKEPSDIFGGTNRDALQSNTWIPCGDSVKLTSTQGVTFRYSYGDTYYQRYDCLKTYAFTPEDENQIVEIGSFMLETHINIDGRYDRNRGQLDNTMMSPTNFNLINYVYSQQDNFFSYKILDSSFYDIDNFANQITWTKQKQNGAIIDTWTNINLASTIDLEGTKGEIVSLNLWQDQLRCFQKKGISTILFNSRVQIPTSDNIPIEITNSYKVDGYKYLTYDIGCSNKNLIKETPSGIYFIDDITNNLYKLDDQVSDISTTHNMVSWFRNNDIYKVLYDNVNHNVYVVTSKEALCYSELLNEFMSRFSYPEIDVLESYGQKLFLIKNLERYTYDEQLSISTYIMNEGSYNNYLVRRGGKANGSIIITNDYHPWSISFISNGFQNKHISFDKIFSNIEYRMDIYDESNQLSNKSFKTISVNNEYQDTGIVSLENTKNRPSNLKKKFRIWRVQIPRNNKIDSNNRGSRDRIRNTWCNITLTSDREPNKAVLHDINVFYYI